MVQTRRLLKVPIREPLKVKSEFDVQWLDSYPRSITYLVKGVMLELSMISSKLSGGLDSIELFCLVGEGKVTTVRLPFSTEGLEKAYPGTERGLLSWKEPLLSGGLFGSVLQ